MEWFWKNGPIRGAVILSKMFSFHVFITFSSSYYLSIPSILLLQVAFFFLHILPLGGAHNKTKNNWTEIKHNNIVVNGEAVLNLISASILFILKELCSSLITSLALDHLWMLDNVELRQSSFLNFLKNHENSFQCPHRQLCYVKGKYFWVSYSIILAYSAGRIPSLKPEPDPTTYLIDRCNYGREKWACL